MICGHVRGLGNSAKRPQVGGEPERVKRVLLRLASLGHIAKLSANFTRGVVTTYALEFGAAGDHDNR